MRVTQSMLSNNMLRNLSSSYNKMGKLQDQLNTGKKVNRPSDNPVVAMKGIAYRHQVSKIEQFKRNIGDVHNWLDSTDAALDNAGQVLNRARELMVNVPTDSLTYDDRQKIVQELKQLQESMHDIANAKVGDKYIFSGTKTGSPFFDKGGKALDKIGVEREVKIEVFDGVELQVNTNGIGIFDTIDDKFKTMIEDIEGGNPIPNPPVSKPDLDKHISEMEEALGIVLEARAVVGARQNRAELMDNRLDLQEMAAKKQMSQNEDIEYEEVITELMTQESIHRAALSIGARIIQPTLVDFLR